MGKMFLFYYLLKIGDGKDVQMLFLTLLNILKITRGGFFSNVITH